MTHTPASPQLMWADIDEVVAALRVAYPTDDPRGLELEELHSKVVQLDAFADDPSQGDAGLLETYRSLWWWGAGYFDTEPWPE